MHWQDIHNLEHYWPEQLAILRRLRDLGKKVFGSNWYDKTFWQGLDLIVTDLDNNTLGTMDDVESAYTISVLSRLERGDLLGMEKALLEADKMMGEVLGVESNITPDPNIFNAAWEDHWWLMGIDADGAAMLAKRSARLSQTDFDKLLSHFDQLTVAYDLVSAQMLAVGALLLYFDGEKRYDFETLVAEFASGAVSDWLSAWRFLGQAFYGRNGDVGKLMLKFLTGREPDFSGDSSTVNNLFEIVILFFVWHDYEYLDFETKGFLIKKYIWASLAAGVPIEKCVKSDLATEQYLDFYLSACFNLTENLGNGEEKFIGLEDESPTVGDFIKNFTQTVGNSDIDGLEQSKFVKAQITANAWPVEWEGMLLRLIYLYIHSRECDLIDYKGLLSEAGIEPRPFEWRQIVHEDLTPEKLKMIKDWLVMYNRPFTVKMEMVVEFMKVSFNTEPYLSRILELSETFEEVYGPEMSPLLYFSEEENKWQLNHDRPPKSPVPAI